MWGGSVVTMLHEVEWGYFGIPDDILDGIHPEEDTDKIEDTAVEDGKVEVDQVGGTIVLCSGGCCLQEVGDQVEKEVKVNLGQENLTRKINEKKKVKANLEYNVPRNFLLSYANYHISTIFIIVLSLTTLLFPGYNNIVITVIIIIVIAVTDHRYDIGIRNKF